MSGNPYFFVRMAELKSKMMAQWQQNVVFINTQFKVGEMQVRV